MAWCLVVVVYGVLTLFGSPFLNGSTTYQLGNSVPDLVLQLSVPTTPKWQRHQALTPLRFRLIPFRSPLLRESLLLSSPQGTEMFQFPWFPLPALCVQAGVTPRSEEHTSELQSLMRISYAVFCLKKKKSTNNI